MNQINVGINGFGRIARVILRSLEERDTPIRVCAVNVRNADYEKMAYMLKYDSVFGRFRGEIEPTETGIRINGKDIRVFSENDPARINWKEAGAEYIIEVRNSGGTEVALTVDGEAIDGTTVPYAAPGTTVHITASV